MPVGWTQALRRDQILDLVRFLSELGKEGPWKVPVAQFVRRWRVLEHTAEVAEHLRDATGELEGIDDPSRTWLPAYSTVAGHLPLDDVPMTSVDAGATRASAGIPPEDRGTESVAPDRARTPARG